MLGIYPSMERPEGRSAVLLDQGVGSLNKAAGTNGKLSYSGRKVSVLIADDHTLFRQGLRQLLEMEPDIEIVAEAGDGQEAIAKALSSRPDIALLDIQMPVLDGVAVIKRLGQLHPQGKCIVLTMYRQDKYVFDAIKSGAYGYLLKDSDFSDVVKAIRAVNRGEALVDPAIAIKVLEEFRKPLGVSVQKVSLTGREMEILKLVAKGLGNQEIAKTLCLSEKTVRNRLSIIFQKLHINNRTEAALYAIKEGIIPVEGEEGQGDEGT